MLDRAEAPRFAAAYVMDAMELLSSEILLESRFAFAFACTPCARPMYEAPQARGPDFTNVEHFYQQLLLVDVDPSISCRLFEEVSVSYYPDMSPCLEFSMLEASLVAVGWLDPAHSYSKGPTHAAFAPTLERLRRNCWQPIMFMGLHFCELCPQERHSGAHNLWIPGRDRLFVSPELIAHYIEAHEYAPPEEYVTAVLDCPEMGSPEYMAQIAKLGLVRQRNGRWTNQGTGE